MKTTNTTVCPVCGKETAPGQTYCSEVCKLSAKYDIKETPLLPADVNLTVGEIIDIMQTLNITYSEYSKSIESRKTYIAKYKEVQNNGIV